MRQFILSLLFSMAVLPLHADPISGLLGRILPQNGDARKFEWSITPDSVQRFTLRCDGQKVHVSGTDYISIAAGINWYLQHYASVDISWNAPTGMLPAVLPVCPLQTHVAAVPLRYYLNFCTYSYSMAFWDWDRWQQELDWMALHGVNMPLAVTGMECVWRRVLEEYGYASTEDVGTFVCGSAYYGWFFMNNLTAWGGPQPRRWYTQQERLAQRIFRRMGEYGMTPVVPGYVGMVPRDFLERAKKQKVAAWTPADIVDGGRWCSFTRPAFVNNTDRMKELAARYYAAFHRLYGRLCPTHFYAIDPFHEGGVPDGVTDARASVAAMWEALTAYDVDAVWVAQHWQDNPRPLLTHTLPRGRLVILDLHGDNNGDTVCSGHHTTERGEAHDWIWGQVSNFGGNVGLFGRMDRLIDCFYAAHNGMTENHLVGIGALPEGIENNPMLYDLLYALPWTTTAYTRASWLADYVRMRYGLTSDDKTYDTLLSAWTRLGAGIYNCPNDHQQGTTESVFLMRPSLQAGTVSSWASSTWYWDMADVRQALAEMLSVSDVMGHRSRSQGVGDAGWDNYCYDLVDLCRQALADEGKLLLDRIREAVSSQDDTAAALSASFLGLILDQDRLLGTRREFRLGRWTEAARRLGRNAAEKDLYERNARMLLTTWGDRAQCEQGGLHDYANREWQGLLASYYYPRWKAFFQNNATAQDWFSDFEWPFANGALGAINSYLPSGAASAYGSFSATAEGDAVAIVKELFGKYLEKE